VLRKQVNPFASPGLDIESKKQFVRFRLAFTLFVLLWPLLAFVFQGFEVLVENLLSVERIRISDFVVRNHLLQCLFLIAGVVTCILAAIRDRANVESIHGRVMLTFFGAIMVLIEIAIFHPPSSG